MALLGKRRRGSTAVLLSLCALLAATGCARAESLEDAIKATYVYKFAPFVTWPAAAHSDVFTVCVFGADDVSALLPQATAGQEVDGRHIAIRSLTAADVPSDCRILYVANAPAAQPLLAALHGRSILTVTDGNSPEHGIVQFIVIDHHVRFDIDEKLAAQSGLLISSKLLGLAHAVAPQGRE